MAVQRDPHVLAGRRSRSVTSTRIPPPLASSSVPLTRCFVLRTSTSTFINSGRRARRRFSVRSPRELHPDSRRPASASRSGSTGFTRYAAAPWVMAAE